MKRLCLLFATAIYLSVSAQPNANPTHTLTFTITQGDGKNGIAVAYHTSKQIYYCAMAGNATFPLEAFLGTKTVFIDTLGFDARGLWYNAKNNTLEGNAFNYDGVYAISLDDKGLPNSAAVNKYPGGQPGEHSVGAYDAAKGTVLYFDNVTKEVIRYKVASAKPGKPIPLVGCPSSFADIGNAMIYTGKKGYEIGIYDFVGANIYFFDKKGNYADMSSLGQDAPYNEMFNFSYANGYVFLFDTDMREWWGYKVFE